MVTPLYKWNILELGESNMQSINQPIIKARLSVLQYFDFLSIVKIPDRFDWTPGCLL